MRVEVGGNPLTDDRTAAIEALLRAAGDAHHEYEERELGGVYDAEWPAWYGRWVVEHGLGGLLGHEVDRGEVAAYFTRTWTEAEASDPKPSEPWATWVARRIAAEL